MTGASKFLVAASPNQAVDAGDAAVLGASLRAVFGEPGAREDLHAAYKAHRSEDDVRRVEKYLGLSGAPAATRNAGAKMGGL